MRVYLAGPMTGLPQNNREAFAYAWNKLIEEGFDAISPHFLESAIEIETRAKMGTAAVYRHVLPVDCFAISSADAVLALPGWEDSRGCNFERHFADLIEIPWITSVQDGDFIPMDRCPMDPADTYLAVVKYAVTRGIEQLKEHAIAHSRSS